MIRFIDHNFKPDLIVSGFTPCSACVIVLRVRPSASLAPEIENRSSSEPRFLLQILPSDFSLVTTVPLEKILALPIWNRRAPPVHSPPAGQDPAYRKTILVSSFLTRASEPAHHHPSCGSQCDAAIANAISVPTVDVVSAAVLGGSV
jgi:hypothetical protein